MSDHSKHRRVAVVGGGVVGCATAYYLARAGAHVSLIERDAIAAHASGCNAGNLNPLHRTPKDAVPLALEAFALHREVAAELARLGCSHYTLQSTARVHLGKSEEDRRELEETAALFAGAPGFSSAWLDRAELAGIESRLAEDFCCGVLISGNLSVDSRELTRSLAEGAVRLGASVRLEAASDVVVSGARVTGVRTREGIVPCDEVVFATGPWSAELRSWLGIDQPVEPVKGELLLMRLPGGAPAHDLHFGSAALYRRQADQVWVGGTMVRCGFDDAPSAQARALLLSGAAGILPAMKFAEVIGHFAALRPVSTTKLPIAARAPGWENVYLANGGGMKGVLLSLGIARKIRDLLLGCRAESAFTESGARRAASLH